MNAVPDTPLEPQEAPSPGDINTILVADDHALVRSGLRALVSKLFPGVNVVEAVDGDSLLKAARAHPNARLGLVDLNMPGMERGFRLTELALWHPKIPLVVVSALTSPDVVRRTLHIDSVHAFVPKSAPTEQTRAAIMAALRGDKVRFSFRSLASQADSALTPRHEEVLMLIRQGMSNKLIGDTLGITEGTVKNYVSHILRILHVSNRTQAANDMPDSQ